MKQIATVEEVFDAIQQVKAGAPAFYTNFFPVQKRLRAWIDHGELSAEVHGNAVFFWRKDRDIQHLYFASVDIRTLGEGLAILSMVPNRMVTDLVGDEASVGAARAALESAGFRPYAKLQRMARMATNRLPSAASEPGGEIGLATIADAPAIVKMLETSFDHCADQLPLGYEVEAAVGANQILVIKNGTNLAAMLHFETQGVTSTLRFWAVGDSFRSRQFGSALIRHYFAMHAAVRRFLLWVVTANENAVQKYEHYGYIADGLVDNVMIRAGKKA